MIFGINKAFFEIVAISLIIGGIVYLGFLGFSQINNQLASLQEQLTPLVEKSIEIVPEEPIISATSTATSTVSEEPSPEPKEEVNVCESLNCDTQDGWNNSGAVFTCQNIDNQTCACQTQAYFDYSCSTSKQKCVYSTTKTRTSKYNCVEPAYPDLIFQSLGFSPTIPEDGNQMYFWATLKNQGSAAANFSLSYLKIDGQKIGESSAVSLTGNGTIVVAWAQSWQAIAGSHELEVCADGALGVVESNEINNCAKTTFTVVGGAVAPAGGSTPLPDLVVESIYFSPDPLSQGQSVNFSATIKNQGGVSARPSVTVPTLDLGNNGSWDRFPGAMPTQAIATSSSATVIWRDAWTSTPGTHKIEVCADAVSEPELRIVESSENNNCLSKIFIVP